MGYAIPPCYAIHPLEISSPETKTPVLLYQI